MFLQELFITEGPQTVAFCWGRFQPPHRAHGELFKTLATVGNYDYWICASQTQGPKDPLDYSTKMNFIRLQHPELADHVLEDPSIKTIYQAIVAIYNKYDPKVAENLTLVFVGDAKRVSQFVPGFQQYNGVEGKHGYYKFGMIAGHETARDADSETDTSVTDPDQDISKINPANISGSLVRNLAAAGDFEKFKFTVSKTGKEPWVKDMFTALGGKVQKVKDQEMAERSRDPEDWDEGNREPPNNFAVYINGKKWKVFQGRGRFADDQYERKQYQDLKLWARKKSAETGKQWEVSITGEPATMKEGQGFDVLDTYKGWKFETETQAEDDRYVTFYGAVSPEGKWNSLPKRATVDQFRQFVDSQSIAESKERCPQCGMVGCSCPPGKCGCKPIKGWIPNKGFKKDIDESKETVTVPVKQKPRQGPLRPQTGGGKHRDKKKEQKQGQQKHKQKVVDLGESWNHELAKAVNKLIR